MLALLISQLLFLGVLNSTNDFQELTTQEQMEYYIIIEDDFQI